MAEATAPHSCNGGTTLHPSPLQLQRFSSFCKEHSPTTQPLPEQLQEREDASQITAHFSPEHEQSAPGAHSTKQSFLSHWQGLPSAQVFTGIFWQSFPSHVHVAPSTHKTLHRSPVQLHCACGAQMVRQSLPKQPQLPPTSHSTEQLSSSQRLKAPCTRLPSISWFSSARKRSCGCTASPDGLEHAQQLKIPTKNTIKTQHCFTKHPSNDYTLTITWDMVLLQFFRLRLGLISDKVR